MMRSLFSGVAGLTSHQTRMDVIGNNIANVNTIGFKKSRVTFQDMLSQTLRTATAPGDTRGGVNPLQVGLGVQLGTIDVVHTEGATEPTGVQTDLSIRGNGFFVLLDGEQQLFTRAGAFDLEQTGWLVSKATGIRVAGWNAVDGNINTNQPLEQIQVPIGQTLPAQATTRAVLEGNLNAAAGGRVGDVVRFTVDMTDSSSATHPITLEFVKVDDDTWAWSARDSNGAYLNLAAGHLGGTYKSTDQSTWPRITFDAQGQLDTSSEIPNIVIGTETIGGSGVQAAINAEFPFPKVVTTVEAVDSLGVRHRVIVEFEIVGPNKWRWRVPDVDNPGAYLGQGTLLFTDQGELESVTSTTVTMNGSPGSAPLSFELDFSRLSQYGAESAVAMRSQNGFGSGTLEEVRIDGTGKLTGVFSNGLTRELAQLALATFSNNGGLLRSGESMFEQSRNSGLAQIGAAGTADRGLVTPGTLEMSNVDLSEEFTSMIITQRGFQANSRIITTSDEMLQELVNLKR